MGRRSECPWAVRWLAMLAAVFILAAVYQITSGAIAAVVASRTLRVQVSKNKDILDDIEMKRSVQQAFRAGGLFIPLEDVILSQPVDAGSSDTLQQRNARVWIPVHFKVPWLGSFVYGFSREFVISRVSN